MNPRPVRLTLCVDVLGPLVLRVRRRARRGPGRSPPRAAGRARSGRGPRGGDRAPGRGAVARRPARERRAGAVQPRLPAARPPGAGTATDCERHGGGYRLHLEPDELDVDAARRLATPVARTRAAKLRRLAAPPSALWRGPALEEFRRSRRSRPAVALDELRLRLVDDLLDGPARRGGPAVTVDARGRGHRSPLRERTACCCTRARCGRTTAEAMAAAQAFRRRLAEETGLDPGPGARRARAAGRAAATLAAAPDHRRTGPSASWPVPTARSSAAATTARRCSGSSATNATVTVTGPGGVGKTRLALDVAADLRRRRRTEEVASSTSRPSTGRTRLPGGRLDPGPPHPATVGRRRTSPRRSRAARLLLVLDNCEHVADACRDLVAHGAAHAPPASGCWRRPGSPCTSRVSTSSGSSRCRSRATPPTSRRCAASRRSAPSSSTPARRPGFEVTEADAADLVEVLRRLDGLPLGIELAARQVAVMPLHAVRERLDRALDLATGRGGPDDDRQRTLRATIDSSYRCSRADERRCCGLAPFPGGVDLADGRGARRDGARSDPLDLLHRLVDASLVVADPPPGATACCSRSARSSSTSSRATDELDAAETRFLDRCLVGRRGDRRTEMSVPTRPGGPPAAGRARQPPRRPATSRRPTAVTTSGSASPSRSTEAATWRDLRELWAWALELAADPALRDHPRPRGAPRAAPPRRRRLLGDLGRRRRSPRGVAQSPDPDADAGDRSCRPSRRWVGRALPGRLRRGEASTGSRSGGGAAPASGQPGGVARWPRRTAATGTRPRRLLDRRTPPSRRQRATRTPRSRRTSRGSCEPPSVPRSGRRTTDEAIEQARRCGATFVGGRRQRRAGLGACADR